MKVEELVHETVNQAPKRADRPAFTSRKFLREGVVCMWLFIAVLCICGIVLFALYLKKDVIVSMSLWRFEFSIDARDAAAPRREGKRRPRPPLD
jgi:hypothetical protein